MYVGESDGKNSYEVTNTINNEKAKSMTEGKEMQFTKELAVQLGFASCGVSTACLVWFLIGSSALFYVESLSRRDRKTMPPLTCDMFTAWCCFPVGKCREFKICSNVTE